jgi:hypothetical protein
MKKRSSIIIAVAVISYIGAMYAMKTAYPLEDDAPADKPSPPVERYDGEPLYNPETHLNGYCEGYCWEGICPFFDGYAYIDHVDDPDDAPGWDDPADLARLIWGEARGVPSMMERAAVVWCVLNRVDDPRWPDTIEEVVTQPRQFTGYSADFPATDEHIALAADVLLRWQLEKIGAGDAGRVLPAEFVYFTGDGRNNHFTVSWPSNRASAWKWTLDNPYIN